MHTLERNLELLAQEFNGQDTLLALVKAATYYCMQPCSTGIYKYGHKVWYVVF